MTGVLVEAWKTVDESDVDDGGSTEKASERTILATGLETVL